jgi:beta-galactosidase
VKHQWSEAGYDRIDSHIYSARLIKQTDKEIVLQTESSLGGYSIKPVMHLNYTWTVYGNGELKLDVNARVREGLPFLPRFGMMFTMPEGYERTVYFGYGPHESYIDKRRSTRKSRYRTDVDAMFENYPMPQENGSHYQTDWAAVTNLRGMGLLFLGEENFSFHTAHYTPMDLTNAGHPYELIKRKETIVHIDGGMSGVGSNSCGPELLPQYRLSETELSFAFRVKPVCLDEISPSDCYRTEYI